MLDVEGASPSVYALSASSDVVVTCSSGGLAWTLLSDSPILPRSRRVTSSTPYELARSVDRRLKRRELGARVGRHEPKGDDVSAAQAGDVAVDDRLHAVALRDLACEREVELGDRRLLHPLNAATTIAGLNSDDGDSDRFARTPSHDAAERESARLTSKSVTSTRRAG